MRDTAERCHEREPGSACRRCYPSSFSTKSAPGQRPPTSPTLSPPSPGGPKAFRPTGCYLLLDEVRLADSVGHLPTGNLSAALFRLEASHTPADIVALIEALVDWLRAPEQSRTAPRLHRLAHPRLSPQAPSWRRLHHHSGLARGQRHAIGADRTLEKQWEQRGLEKGLQRGIREGLRRERDLLVRQIRKRFGLAIADESALLLAPIDAAVTLGDLAEQLLGSADGAGWLDAIRSMAPKALGSAGQGASCAPGSFRRCIAPMRRRAESAIPLTQIQARLPPVRGGRNEAVSGQVPDLPGSPKAVENGV